MSVDVRPEVVVRKPRAEVAAYMFDPANDLAWTGGITASRPDRPGPLVAGATVVRTAKFLGRTFDYGYVVTAHEPGRLIEMKVEKPFPMTVRYELADVAEGTNVAIWASGSPGGFFSVAEPLMRWQVRRSIAADLGRLKKNVEAVH